ncbi:MAG: acyl-ACP--UDP-N-acetylglucosamine O-acyltransferase [Methylococcaceae bacterium]
MSIHPTSCVDPAAQLAENVHVGPFAVIESGVVIGSGCHIHAHAVIHKQVRMGSNNQVFPHAVLGGLPQDLSFDPDTCTYLDIGEGNVFREGVSVSRATHTGAATRIGSFNFLMNNSHVAHDCRLGDHNIMASGATLGGHVDVGDRVFFGGGVMVHQFCRIGSLAMLQGLAGINKDALPYTMIGGRPGKHYRLNLVGMRRAGLGAEAIRALSQAYRRLRRRESLDGLPDDIPELAELIRWLAAPSKRGGILGFITAERHASE